MGPSENTMSRYRMISYESSTTTTARGRRLPRTGTIDVISSATEAAIGRVPRGTAEDVDRAVKAARARLRALEPRAPRGTRAVAREAGRRDEATRSADGRGDQPRSRARRCRYSTKVQVEFPITMIGMNARFLRERHARGGPRATRWSSRSRSASSAASRRGTTRCTRWSARLRRRWPPAAPWC